MDAAIWVITIIAVIGVIIIYVITSVKKYSDSFVGKYFDEDAADNNNSKDKDNEKNIAQKKKNDSY